MVKKKFDPNYAKRERQCVIVSKTLEDILATCDRNISNIHMTLMDTLQEGDDTPSDHFYCKHYEESWQDLRDDVLAMLVARDKEAAKPKTPSCVHLVDVIESERGWGQRHDGYLAFRSEEDAKAYITDATKDYKGPAPDYYVRYDYAGIKECSAVFYNRFKNVKSPTGCVPIDHLKELQE